MKTSSFFGRLAAATLLFSAVGTAAQAQVQTHRVPAYTGKAQARSVSAVRRPAASTGGAQIGIRAGVNVSDWSGDAVQSVDRKSVV